MWYAAIVTVMIAAFLVGFVALLLAWRRLRRLRMGGIDVALRDYREEPGRGWHLGVARYRGEEFAWYRALSVRSGPDRVFNRGNMEIATRREPATAEMYAMPTGSVVLHLSRPGDDIEVAMGPDALTGFLSWLESAPPGSSAPWAS